MSKKITKKKDRQPTLHCENGRFIDSKEVQTDTLFDVVTGKKYFYSAEGTWYDNLIETDADGFEDAMMNLVAGRLQRVPEARWFQLCGKIGDQDRVIIMGRSGWFTAHATGRLYCFVNDVLREFTMENNLGGVCLQIREADEPV